MDWNCLFHIGIALWPKVIDFSLSVSLSSMSIFLNCVMYGEYLRSGLIVLHVFLIFYCKNGYMQFKV